MEEWIERVRVAANECDYQEQERQIIEQFISGLNDEHVQNKILSEIKTRSKTDKITNEQVNMWAIQEESNITQIRETGQTETCRYCGSNHPPRRCPAYGVTCGESTG